MASRSMSRLPRTCCSAASSKGTCRSVRVSRVTPTSLERVFYGPKFAAPHLVTRRVTREEAPLRDGRYRANGTNGTSFVHHLVHQFIHNKGATRPCVCS